LTPTPEQGCALESSDVSTPLLQSECLKDHRIYRNSYTPLSTQSVKGWENYKTSDPLSGSGSQSVECQLHVLLISSSNQTGSTFLRLGKSRTSRLHYLLREKAVCYTKSGCCTPHLRYLDKDWCNLYKPRGLEWEVLTGLHSRTWQVAVWLRCPAGTEWIPIYNISRSALLQDINDVQMEKD
jgi:hypothetical protein